jgi:hypothetical protein
MKITIRIDKNYGVETAYPACERAQLFARIAGTKSLTRNTLRDVAALGYQIEIEQTTPRTFAHLTAA